MKRKIIAGIILFAGVCLLMYPVVGNIINVIRQNSVQSQYNQMVQQLDEETKERLKSEAEEYNQKLANGGADSDAYNSALDIGLEEIGFIKIPKIGIELPIYRGTSEEVLQKGVGHLESSSLPVGGISTHCVLTGHTGLPSSMLFTDLTKLETGDKFYIKYLDEILAYQVDQIKIVEPTDTSDLKIVDGKDYVTLLTCTPYGINSHRLLVRGERVEFNGEVTFGEDGSVTISGDNEEMLNELTGSSNLISVYGLYAELWVVILVAVLVIIAVITAVVIAHKRRKKRNNNNAVPELSEDSNEQPPTV